MVEKLRENDKVDQDMLNDELDGVNLDIPNDESENEVDVPDFGKEIPTPTPVIGSNNVSNSQSSQSSNVQDDETCIYKGMTFKNKQELVTSLKIALEKIFLNHKGD